MGMTLGFSPLVVGCKIDDPSKKESDTNEEEKVGDTEFPGDDSKATIESLKLSQMFELELPPALLNDDQTNLALNGSKRSKESCEIGNLVRDGFSSLFNFGNEMCWIEQLSNQIKLGVKTLIVQPDFKNTVSQNTSSEESYSAPCGDPTHQPGEDPCGTPEDDVVSVYQEESDGTFAIWLDDSQLDEGILEIQFCTGTNRDSLTFNNFVRVEGLLGETRQGYILDHYDGEESNFKSISSFSLDQPNKTAQISYDLSYVFGASEGRNQMKIDLSPTFTGASSVSVTSESNTEKSKSAAKAAIDTKFGSAVIFDLLTHNNGQESTQTVKAFFDKTGTVTAKEGNAAFEADGPLDIKVVSLPELIPEGFIPKKMPTNPWDCTTEVEVDFLPSDSKFDSCFLGSQLGTTNCQDESKYQEGEFIGEKIGFDDFEDNWFEDLPPPPGQPNDFGPPPGSP
jgi:hypothetical protein